MAFTAFPFPPNMPAPIPQGPTRTELQGQSLFSTALAEKIQAIMTTSTTDDKQETSALLPRTVTPRSSITPLSQSTPPQQLQTSTPTTLTTLTTANSLAQSRRTTTATAPPVTQTYYPPASSHFALSVPSIIGIVVAGVGFLVLLAIIAAFTVCYLDRKKENDLDKDEKTRKANGKGKEKVADLGTENASTVGHDDSDPEPRTGNAATTDEHDDALQGPSVIGPRYARMIGVDTTPTHPHHPTPSSSSASPSTRGRSIVHLPVHVADLGTPRQSQTMVQYEREDPDEEERDERGMRRGASWWHPEL